MDESVLFGRIGMEMMGVWSSGRVGVNVRVSLLEDGFEYLGLRGGP